jgi:hypothetical protein
LFSSSLPTISPVTDEHTADETTTLAIRLPGLNASSVVVDGTACIGGNVLSFAKQFQHVVAIELDPGRCTMLKHNVDVMQRHYAEQSNHGGGGAGGARIDVKQGDCLAVVKALRQVPAACIFLDPPWGGVAYKDQATVPLALGKNSLAEVCRQLLVMPHLQTSLLYILLKVPFNYDQAGMQSTCQKQGCTIRTVSLSKKVKLLVLARKQQPKQQPKQKHQQEAKPTKAFAIRVKKRKRK